jgi:hypothetical protein
MISPNIGCLQLAQFPLEDGFSLSMVFICVVKLLRRESKSSPLEAEEGAEEGAEYGAGDDLGAE